MPRTMEPKARIDPDFVSQFARFDDSDVEEWTDSGSFKRGRTYFRQGAIVSPILTGDTISAECWGSQPHPYHVTAQLAPAGDAESNEPLAFSCTCPRGGFCKHIVALLLTWIDDPGKFTERPSLAELLAERSKDELIAIIERLVRRDPDLMRLVELPMPAGKQPAGQPNEVTIDPESISRQVAAILRSEKLNEWGAAGYVASELEGLLNIGRSYAKAGALADAATVAAALAESLIASYDSIYDEEGDIGVIIADCDNELASYLDAQAKLPENDRLTPEQRGRIIHTIFDIWREDTVNDRGLELSQEGPEALARNVTAEERAKVLGWLLAMPDQLGEMDDWWRQGVTRSMVWFRSIMTDPAGMDDEALLKLYQDAELWPEVVDLLVDMGRVKEAIGIADRKIEQPAVLLQFADKVYALGDEKREWAVDLVDGRLWETEGKQANLDDIYLDWLAQKYVELDRPEKALAAARRRFQHQPGQATYQAVREAATLPGQPEGTWPPVREELLKTLRQRKEWVPLIEIALEEQDAVAAVDALAKYQKSQSKQTSAMGYFAYSFGMPELAGRVAEAAEASKPDDAIRIYRDAADQLIAIRSRPYYQQAAEYLSRIERILKTQKREDEWTSLIADVRQRNRTLRALKQELDAKKL